LYLFPEPFNIKLLSIFSILHVFFFEHARIITNNFKDGGQSVALIEEQAYLEDRDKKYIWHPFTQMKEWADETPIIIAEGKDCFIKDMYGRSYIDGISSMWVNIHGHRRREINIAIKNQLDRIAHSTLLGLGNIPAIELAEKIVSLLDVPLSRYGRPLNKVFYSDNGSTAVEVALKMAFQYWKHRGIDGRHAFLAFNNAYHGDTLGAVSVGGVDIFHAVFGPLLFKTYKSPSPHCYRCELRLEHPFCHMKCLEALEDLLQKHAGEIAAVIIEPLIQAAGGMIVAAKDFLKGVKKLCNKYDVLLIADEVATGFGRTGTMFACEQEQVLPDIICLSKGITGGYLPLAVTVATQEIYNAFIGEFEELKTFYHGHSYTGNQLGCAAALACLDIFESDGTLVNLQPKIAFLKSWLQNVIGLQHVGDARNAGFMAGVELVRDKKTKDPFPYRDKVGWHVCIHARQKGVFIRPLGNVLVIMPPLAISMDNLQSMLSQIRDSIIAVTET
jgi:adenosylmethionine-8-amino-7-oxononanoate aminotransferase